MKDLILYLGIGRRDVTCEEWLTNDRGLRCLVVLDADKSLIAFRGLVIPYRLDRTASIFLHIVVDSLACVFESSHPLTRPLLSQVLPISLMC